jgi:hypothetical protein
MGHRGVVVVDVPSSICDAVTWSQHNRGARVRAATADAPGPHDRACNIACGTGLGTRKSRPANARAEGQAQRTPPFSFSHPAPRAGRSGR